MTTAQATQVTTARNPGENTIINRLFNISIGLIIGLLMGGSVLAVIG